eukprot:4952654-Lingulodinium_polyedra.AAC.1
MNTNAATAARRRARWTGLLRTGVNAATTSTKRLGPTDSWPRPRARARTDGTAPMMDENDDSAPANH